MGDLGEVRLGVVAVLLLERLGDQQVQLRALGRADLARQRVAHERVDELEAPGVARGRHDAGAQRGVEPLEHLGRRSAGDARERRDAELARR